MITRITTTSTLPITHSAFRARPGMSTAEVLVALFLMALGSIAILTMFPLGMYRMGQALKDDRTAQSAAQADAFMRMYWRINVVENPNATNPAPAFLGYPGYEPFVAALDNPDSKPDCQLAASAPILIRNNPVGTLPNLAGVAGPSYPVFVDPMGYGSFWNSQNPNAYQLQWWVGGQYYGRRTLNQVLNQSIPPGYSQRICSLMDGFGYSENGTPSASNGSLDRELRYNWLWIIQRPDNTNRNTAKMAIVVFDKRAFQYAPGGAEAVFASGITGPTTIVMQPLLTTIQIPLSQSGGVPPPVQKGGWIMDATPVLRHAIFYRVVSVTDNPANGTTDLELQTPIRRLDGGTGAYAGTLIYMAGVSDVFERPLLTTDY